ncbi:MAG: pseudouridine synthase [Candidatus Kapabacteria bacterium]|nr:pseudouridine synthase [Candidatus Kapabacteria bacterium]
MRATTFKSNGKFSKSSTVKSGSRPYKVKSEDKFKKASDKPKLGRFKKDDSKPSESAFKKSTKRSPASRFKKDNSKSADTAFKESKNSTLKKKDDRSGVDKIGKEIRKPSERNYTKRTEKPAKSTSARPTKSRAVKSEADENVLRLNKALADGGVASRRKADELIKSGAVSVNKKIVTDLATRVSKSDFITVNGDPITFYKHNTYLILNKPKDVITSASDELGRKTVLDIIRSRTRLFPVGRLDRNTTGVLLITNDGELTNRLTHPSFEIERTYFVTTDSALTAEHAKRISEGVELEDGLTQPCEIFIHPENRLKSVITLHEGKNREVRRLYEHFGYKVKSLDRKSFAGLTVTGLARGEYRHLTTREVFKLKRFAKMG